ncbi:hypothetical protein GCM10023350_08770 [Nocardioides endophyticus]|uniref:Uncharacterized protein n=1 Tax=Nocardioides endophyticus TaxID=1353775 RepID=A0ABP8YG82_9ACTN
MSEGAIVDEMSLPENWIEDPRQPDDQWMEVLLTQLVAEEMADLERPHVVVYEHVDTGFVTYQGPYPNAMSAVLAGLSERDATCATEGEQVSYKVARLFDADPRFTDPEGPDHPST